MSEIVLEISKAIIDELTAATKIIMETYKLGDSNLINSIEWQYRNDFFMLIANDYFQSVDSGRSPRARKVPVEDLIKWMKRKNIGSTSGRSINAIAFAIQNSIYKNGIKARRFINPIIGQSLDILSEYISETLSVQIVDQIADDLTITLGNT